MARTFTTAKPEVLYGKDTVKIERKVPPFGASSIYPVPEKFKVKEPGYMKAVGKTIVEKSQQEKEDFDVAEAQFIQDSKPLVLKTVENNFISICDLLTSSAEHLKLGFDAIYNILEEWEDVEQRIDLSLKLLAIDAEAKREGGLQWWDTCSWHEDIL